MCMCGIVGYVGPQQAVPILVEGLRKLEYRGYDSAGVAVIGQDKVEIVKAQGKLNVLEGKLKEHEPRGRIGIGHTRWATHGCPSDTNAHPHSDCTGKFAVVHNGIIENFQELREWLEGEGHTFVSECDTEVLPHLVEHYYQGDLVKAVQQMMEKIEGSYAVVVLTQFEPEKLVAARKDSPLIVGLGDGENFFASDIPAILKHTRDTYIIDDGEIAEITSHGVRIMDASGQPVEKEIFHVEWDIQAAEKGGYEHFMIKEIFEQPKAIRETLSGRVDMENGQVVLDEVKIDKETIQQFRKIAIVACGTAYHAGLVGKHVIERMARLPVEVDIASEFRYRDPLIDESTLVVAISQSGETADTLAAVRTAKGKGARVVAITNVVGSSVSREAHDVIYTWAGPEIAVASTKAYITQLTGMYLLGTYLGAARGLISTAQAGEIITALERLPEQAQRVLDQADTVKDWAKRMACWEDAFFIGRGLDHAVAMEGSLKLKEISYIHAEAYAAGELKHGTLALIEDGVPVIALATQEDLVDKMVSNIKEVKARGAFVAAITFQGNQEVAKAVDEVIYIPRTLSVVAPVLAVIPLQLLAYYAAVNRKCDVDKPRNLAKSVTVE